MGNHLTINLSNEEKEAVIKHVLIWQQTNRLKSTRSYKDKIPKSVIEIVIKLITRINTLENDPKEKKKMFFEHIEMLPKKELVTNTNTRADLRHLINLIQIDQKLKGFSYEQLFLFTHWLLRIAKQD